MDSATEKDLGIIRTAEIGQVDDTLKNSEVEEGEVEED